MSADEIDHIAELQKRLYTRDPEQLPKRKFGILHPIKQRTPTSWGETEIPKEKITHPKGSQGYQRFFIFAVVFFLIALGVALFSFYRGAIVLSSKNVEVTILGNSFVGGGEELPIQVQVANKNAADLSNVKLTLNYPKGATDETGTDVVRIERDLGTIQSGKTKTEEFTVVLYGEQGTSRDITANLTYELQGSSAAFQKDATFSVMVSSSPVALTVDAPTQTISNQPFSITIRNAFSGDKTLPNVVTRIEYPNGFVFQSATPKPTAGNNIWNLDNLQKGDERTIIIQGKLIGEEQDEKAFRVYTGTPEDATNTKIALAYSSISKTVTIAKPFITGTISVSGQTGDIVSVPIGSAIEGQVSWINNGSMTVSEPTFSLSIDGASVDFDHVQSTNGFFDKLTKTISWNSDSGAPLTSIAPGQEGSFSFSVPTITPTSGSRDVTLTLSVKGTMPDLNNAEQAIDAIDQKIVKFASTIQFAGKSLYSIGPIKNTGPYPSRANLDTTYTVTWTVLPSENPLANISAQATLPAGVSWTGSINPQAEDIQYSPDTKTVRWNIGSLPKATTAPRSKSVTFQVKARPTKADVDSPFTLLGETTITATDVVTNTQVSTTRPALSTRLDTDPVYTPGKERVLP